MSSSFVGDITDVNQHVRCHSVHVSEHRGEGPRVGFAPYSNPGDGFVSECALMLGQHPNAPSGMVAAEEAPEGGGKRVGAVLVDYEVHAGSHRQASLARRLQRMVDHYPRVPVGNVVPDDIVRPLPGRHALPLQRYNIGPLLQRWNRLPIWPLSR